MRLYNTIRTWQKRKLQEMPGLVRTKTKLPANIWIDTSRTYLNSGHYKRIKFQLNKAVKMQPKNFASISLVDGKVVDFDQVLNQNNCELAAREIKQIENFVQNNLAALNAASDNLILIEDFLKYMIPGGELKSKVDQEETTLTVCYHVFQKINKQDYSIQQLQDAKKLFLTFLDEESSQSFGFSFKDVKNA